MTLTKSGHNDGLSRFFIVELFTCPLFCVLHQRGQESGFCKEDPLFSGAAVKVVSYASKPIGGERDGQVSRGEPPHQ